MSERTSYAPGTPSWVDLGTPDPAAAAAFYSGLFGWVIEQGPPEAGGYRIVRKIASGGFSIVYLAHDAEGQPVAIKEYLPNTLALRGEGRTTPVIAEDHLPAFRYGMKCFFEEGRALAGLSHPNVIRVLNFFRAN